MANKFQLYTKMESSDIHRLVAVYKYVMCFIQRRQLHIVTQVMKRDASWHDVVFEQFLKVVRVYSH